MSSGCGGISAGLNDGGQSLHRPGDVLAREGRDSALLTARRSLLGAAGRLHVKSPLRRQMVQLSELWSRFGSRPSVAMGWAKRAPSLQWRAALGDCSKLVSQVSRGPTVTSPDPVAGGTTLVGVLEVARGCAVAGEFSVAWDLVRRRTRAAGDLASVIDATTPATLSDSDRASLIGAAETEGVSDEVWSAVFRATLGSKEQEGAMALARRRAAKILKTKAGHPRELSANRLVREVQRSRLSAGDKARLAVLLEPVAVANVNATMAVTMAAIWEPSDEKRAVRWLTEGVQRTPRHQHKHERLALGCALASQAVRLGQDALFSKALSLAEAAARATAPGGDNPWECVGAALLARGKVLAADGIASEHGCERLRQALVLHYLKRGDTGRALDEAARHMAELKPRTLSALHRLVPQAKRPAVRRLIASLPGADVRAMSWLLLAAQARSQSRTAEAKEYIQLAMETVQQRKSRRVFLRGLGRSTRLRLAVERVLQTPVEGIAQLVEKRPGPTALSVDEQFAVLTQIVAGLRWEVGVDLKALSQAAENVGQQR